ncbi:hypothetical protein PO909_021676 [Leuciscus waleckii]
MFVEQRYVLARAKLHFTPVVLTPRAHLQRVEGSKTLSPILPLGRESNSLAESGVLLEWANEVPHGSADPQPPLIDSHSPRSVDCSRRMTLYFITLHFDWQFHPDKQRLDVSEGEAEQHLQRFIDVDQAWKILSNEESRKEYNLQLRAHELKQSWPMDAHITLDDMNWDCDTECYTYGCRCGGEFILEKEDTQEMEMVVCCNSCSLSIEVKKVT